MNNAMIDPRDEALHRACPVVAAPLFGVLPKMESGQRVIVASNAVFLQVKRDWLDCVERMGSIDAALPLPYGKIIPCLRFTFGTIPIPLLDAFITAGRAGLRARPHAASSGARVRGSGARQMLPRRLA